MIVWVRISVDEFFLRGNRFHPSAGKSICAALKGLTILVACLVTGIIACSEEVRSWQPPDILLISVDTLRADHLPSYGYGHRISPHIDELAKRSMVFEEAYTQAPFTLPAHVSLFTGLYPERHGVQRRGDTLGPSITTLAEILKDNGYQTAAFANSYFVSPAFGVDRGFDYFDVAHELDSMRNAEQTNTVVLDWLDHAADKPTFLFVHYFDVHSDWQYLPYDSPRKFRDRFAGTMPKEFRAGDGIRFASKFMMNLNLGTTRYRDRELRYIEGLYDAGIAYTDEQLGVLLGELDTRGRLDQMIVIFLSDHGEEFQEHGRLLHTQVFQELVRIPLLFSLPEMRSPDRIGCRSRNGSTRAAPIDVVPGRSSVRVQLVDLLPTLVDCLGIDSNTSTQGRSFRAALYGEVLEPRAVWLENVKRDEWALIDGDWKLIVSPNQKRLYHLATDPRELRDQSEEQYERVAKMEKELALYHEMNTLNRSMGVEREVPENVDRELEALGYLRENQE